jgi:OPT family small oligopeptide transporter
MTSHAEQALRATAQEHMLDPNFPTETMEKIQYDLDQPPSKKLDLEEKALEEEIEDNSPYPEVGAAVSNLVDRSLPVDTFRAWFIGIVFAFAGAFLNQFFAIRYPYVNIGGLAAQLIAYPFGIFFAYALPKGFLNPGPFNVKEHTLITIMANVSFGSAYATDILVTQIHFFNQDFGWTFAMLLCISTQIIGYGMAGICRRYLVYPSAMIWPSNLVNCALFQTLHEEEGYNAVKDNSMSRYKFFMIAFAIVWVYEWFPNYLFAALATFGWVTWLAPNNVVINQLFGVNRGLGMSILTFDWATITTANSSPLMAPWWSEVNVLFGFVLFFWIITPALYYTNTWYSQYMPIMSSKSYDRFGKSYDPSRILNPDVTFNEDLYKAYSPLYLPVSFALTYFLSFASLTCVLVHVGLFYGSDIIENFKQSRTESDDVHRRLMRAYPEVPDWWYLVLFVIAFIFAMITTVAWDTHLPWWGLIVCLLLPMLYTIPIGIIQAITNIQPGLNVITEFICGYMLPGRPIANTMFKVYGYISMAQALSFVSDLKIGHYMKIPPRSMFWAQTVASVIAAVVNCAVVLWQLKTIEGVCTDDQPQQFNCRAQSVFFSAALIWGAIGPSRIFSAGHLYYGTLSGFIIGVVLPIPGWFLARKYPNRWYKYINWPIILGGVGQVPPATGYNFTMWGLIGFIFQYVVRRRYFNWWSKYNYVLSAALDSGTSLSIFIAFLVFTYVNGGIELDWWGNTDYANNLDMMGGARSIILAENQTFGLTTWE